MKNIKTDELEKQLEEANNNWKRALADYQNLEKRTGQEKEEFAKYCSKEIILKLLPVLDSLEKLVEHINDEGTKLVLKQFQDILSKEGVEKIEVVGNDFNPEEMECVETFDGEENKIEETRSGYKLKGKVIRPALVKVGKRANF